LTDFIFIASVITGFILNPVGSLIVGFASAVIAGIGIRLWLNHHYRPRLVIEGNDTIIVKDFHLLDPEGRETLLKGNRIRVRNKGRSAAKDCKAFVHYSASDVKRTAWLIPDNDIGYTLTLNVQDREFVDLCSISDNGQIRIIPPEHGYTKNQRYDAYVHLPPERTSITVRITSSTAKPTEREVRLYTVVNHFPNDRGRIVEFPQSIISQRFRRCKKN
jgi:hypothetical protein